jgi:hypothetical protein
MDVHNSYLPIWSLQHHHHVVCRFHRLSCRTSHCKRLAKPARVSPIYITCSGTNVDLMCSIRLIKTNRTLQDIVIALLATYGLYFISSFMHFEPWHMFTSFIQYMFLLPSYVNILMMYAMCNLHDVTWGTKGDNGAAKDLGGAKKVKGENGKEMLEVELPTAREDVDHLWIAARNALKAKAPEEKQHRDAATKQADHDRTSRTNVVLAWFGTNMCVFSGAMYL